MLNSKFWIAAIATVALATGAAYGVAGMFEGENGNAVAMLGSALGSALSVLGFGLLLRRSEAAIRIFGVFFIAKILLLGGGAILLWKVPQLGRVEFYMAGFLGGAFLGSLTGGLFLFLQSKGEIRAASAS